MRDDARAGLAQPLVRAGLFRMPVGVDQRMNLLRARFLQSELHELRGARLGAAIDEQGALGRAHDHDVSPSAADDGELVVQLRGRERRLTVPCKGFERHKLCEGGGSSRADCGFEEASAVRGMTHAWNSSNVAWRSVKHAFV